MESKSHSDEENEEYSPPDYRQADRTAFEMWLERKHDTTRFSDPNKKDTIEP